MRAAIEYVSGEAADSEFENEKRHLAMLEQGGHERVAFRGHVQAHPKYSELGVEPVQTKEEQAFGKCTHGSPRKLCLNSFPNYVRTPKLWLEGP